MAWVLIRFSIVVVHPYFISYWDKVHHTTIQANTLKFEGKVFKTVFE